MKIITTHVNADFDCVASMVACQKLHPDYLMVFSGSQERVVRNYLKEAEFHFPFYKPKEIDENKVSEIILVDTQTTSRLGKFNEIAAKEGMVKKIYDHHVPPSDTYPTAEKVIKKRGSSTTVLIEELIEKNIQISKEEANIFLLGIFQDTGNFTYATTCPEDLSAAAKLLESGGNPTEISMFLKDEFTEEEFQLISALLESNEKYQIAGFTLNIATAVTDGYVEGLSTIVNKVKYAKENDITFLIVQMDNSTYLVGRNSYTSFPMQEIFKAIGGGGHNSAASANLKNQTFIQVKEELLSLITQQSKSSPLVQELMNKVVYSVDIGDTVEECKRKLNFYSKTSLPVLDKKAVVGFIAQKDVDRAVSHQLTHYRADEIMNEDFTVVYTGDPLSAVQSLIIDYKQPVVPVMDKETDEIIGVISRGDIFKTMFGKETHNFMVPEDGDGKKRKYPQKRDFHKYVNDRLKPEILDLLEQIGTHAESIGMKAYLVGGIVRDLLLHRENLDVDIVIEGDGIEFARSFAKERNAKVRAHEAFNTATIITDCGTKFDVATARVEFYQSPAALPTVEKGSLKMDMSRRDFTVNALALALSGKEKLHIIDYFTGQKDLRDKKIRIINNLSFVEDPTRAFRAIKFEQRFSFSLSKQTERMLLLSIKQGHFKKLSVKRIFSELLQIMREDNPIWGLRRIEELHISQFIHPDLKIGEETIETLKKIKEVRHWFGFQDIDRQPDWSLMYSNAMLNPLDWEKRQELLKQTSLKMGQKEIINWHRESLKKRKEFTFTQKKLVNYPFSRLYDFFGSLQLECILLFIASLETHDEKAKMAEFLRRFYGLRFKVNGKDLMKLGLKAGPVFSQIQNLILKAELDDLIHSEEEKKDYLINTILPLKKEAEGTEAQRQQEKE